jgi:hypothetical protein
LCAHVTALFPEKLLMCMHVSIQYVSIHTFSKRVKWCYLTVGGREETSHHSDICWPGPDVLLSYRQTEYVRSRNAACLGDSSDTLRHRGKLFSRPWTICAYMQLVAKI